MKNTFLILLALFTSLACAQPNYINTDSSNDNGTKQSLKCQAQLESGHCISLSWNNSPKANESTEALLKVYRLNNSDNSPVLESLDGDLNVVLWMPSMGHGSAPVTVNQTDVGTYELSDVLFIMPGQWEIKILIKNNTETIDEAVININL